MKFGYIRELKDECDKKAQYDALNEYGVDTVNEEVLCGTREKPQLNELLVKLKSGDFLIIFSLSKLGRTVKQLISLLENFEERGISFVSLQEGLDTSTENGKYASRMFCALAQMERDVISERTLAGLDEARKKGREGGRRPVDEKKIETAINSYLTDELSVPEICVMTRISKATLYKYINIYRNEKQKALAKKPNIVENKDEDIV